MNTNKFFEAFTELDNDLIENALPQTNEPEIARPAERIRLWKPIVSAAALLVIVCGVTVAGMKIYNSIGRAPANSVSESGKSSVSAISSPDPANSFVNYSYISIDEQVYFSARELVNKSDIAVMGKVTDISFELHDEHTGELLTEYSEDAWLCTIYDVDVIKAYKGDENEKVRIIMYNGLKDYKVGKQLDLVGEHNSIPVLDNPVDINLGGEYLFLLRQSVYDNSAMLHLINHSQGVFRTDKPTDKERYSQASFNDIVDNLTNTVSDNHSEEVSVIHNAQHVSLSDWQYTTLMDAVLQTVTTECLPDAQLQMELSDQRIKEYRQNGYAITIQYQPTYGESSDKMARGICSVTVLIGKDGEPSYLTYSYIVSPLSGNSEQQDGGTYALSDSSRERLLQILGGQSSDDHETSDGQETSSQPGPNAYLDTMPATYESAKEQITFVDVKEISDPDFVGYELDYVMPSKTLISLNYVFKDGKEVSVIDNGSGIGTIEITPECYEEIKRGDMSFWRDLSTDRNTVIYISESNIAYIAVLGLDTNISHAVDMIVSLL